jgi:predicted NBD/HSP70 family sugar kinase
VTAPAEAAAGDLPGRGGAEAAPAARPASSAAAADGRSAAPPAAVRAPAAQRAGAAGGSADAGDDRPQRPEDPALRGSNQAGMRAHNERLVLTLVRQNGALAKSDIARITGLSAQTVSVIMRALEADGLLVRGDPVRGRIGQPSVPLSLAPDGAFFLGLKVGRRSCDLVLVDFLGRPRAFRRRVHPWPTPGGVRRFTAAALPEVLAALAPAERARVAGIGIAMPFQLWSWVEHIGAPQAEMDAWRTADLAADLAALTGLPATVQNDATSACRAELVFGRGEKPADFLSFYVGFFIGGGLVLGGRLFTGRTGNAAGVGPMPVPGRDGRMRRLLEIASLATIAARARARGLDDSAIWETPEHWDLPPGLVEDWIEEAAEGLASAALSAASLVELQAVYIEGWMPAPVRAALAERTRAAFFRLDLSGIDPPEFREGTIGPNARALGAAAIPLTQRYLLD